MFVLIAVVVAAVVVVVVVVFVVATVVVTVGVTVGVTVVLISRKFHTIPANPSKKFITGKYIMHYTNKYIYWPRKLRRCLGP